MKTPTANEYRLFETLSSISFRTTHIDIILASNLDFST